MSIHQSPPKVVFPLRPLPKPERVQACRFSPGEPNPPADAYQKVDARVAIEDPIEAEPSLILSNSDGVHDWIFVQRHDVHISTVPTYSDTASAQGVGPELTTINIQLHDELNKSNACSTEDGRFCYRHCPKCRGGTVKTHRSLATLYSVESGQYLHHHHHHHHHLGPWAPMNAGSYENDVLGIGVWANTVLGQTYSEHDFDL